MSKPADAPVPATPPEGGASYVQIGRWTQCAHCGTFSTLGGSHFCGAWWQEPPLDLGPGWTPGIFQGEAAPLSRAVVESDLAMLSESNEALNAKLDAMAPAGKRCGCSIDRPGDVCMHHSPQVAALTTEVARLREREKEQNRLLATRWDEIERLTNRLARAQANVAHLVARSSVVVDPTPRAWLVVCEDYRHGVYLSQLVAEADCKWLNVKESKSLGGPFTVVALHVAVALPVPTTEPA